MQDYNIKEKPIFLNSKIRTWNKIYHTKRWNSKIHTKLQSQEIWPPFFWNIQLWNLFLICKMEGMLNWRKEWGRPEMRRVDCWGRSTHLLRSWSPWVFSLMPGLWKRISLINKRRKHTLLHVISSIGCLLKQDVNNWNWNGGSWKSNEKGTWAPINLIFRLPEGATSITKRSLFSSNLLYRLLKT